MRTRSVSAVLCIGMFLAGITTGCRKKVAVATPPPPPPKVEVAPPAAPKASLIAEPETIEAGQPSVLRWSSTDATELTITGLGVVEAQGSREVHPTDTTTWTLTANGPGGSAVASTTVRVTIPVMQPASLMLEPPSFADRVSQLADAYFDFDQSNIREDAQTVLTKDAGALRAILNDFPDATVYLEGYCDDRGSAEYNIALGNGRTMSASAFLAALGVPVSRLAQISYGKENPQCTDATEECWQKNRRIHFAAEQNLTEPGQESSATEPSE